MAASDSDRRGFSRIEVYAQANVLRSDTVYLMSVRNISTGGVYLEGTPAEYPDLKPGTDIELVLFGSEEGEGAEEDLNVRCAGRVVRIDAGYPGKRPPGFGVTIDPTSDDERERLTSLLLRATGQAVGNPRR